MKITSISLENWENNKDGLPLTHSMKIEIKTEITMGGFLDCLAAGIPMRIVFDRSNNVAILARALPRVPENGVVTAMGG